MDATQEINIIEDDQKNFLGKAGIFVTFGEVLIRDTPVDFERPERTRRVSISMAGSEYTLAIGLSRLGIPSSYITRIPDNPYGHAVKNIAQEQGVNIEHIVWAPKSEPIGRMIYEMGKTPRKNISVYQRMFSAASRLDAGAIDWKKVLVNAKIFHTSGITFGLAIHSCYDRNYNFEAYKEAISAKPQDCAVGLDFNHRETLWSVKDAQKIMTKVLKDHVDILITTIEDMAKVYNIPCGKYSSQQILDGDFDKLEDEDVFEFTKNIINEFGVKLVGITIRYPDSFEHNRWESVAVDSKGNFFRSPKVNSIVFGDRLGGGDTWNAGFYYGLLTNGFCYDGIRKGVLVGDAATRIKQTLMYDLPIIDKYEIQALMYEDLHGGGKRTVR